MSAQEPVPPGPPDQQQWQQSSQQPQQEFQQQQPWAPPVQPWQQHHSAPAQSSAPWQTPYSQPASQDAAPPPPPPPDAPQPETAPQPADPIQPPAEQRAAGEMTQEQYQAMSAEQQAAYWEQWNAYCAHYYQQPDPQYAGYQQYQQYAAQPGQYTGAGEAHPPAQEAPAYYQQTAPQGYQPPATPQVHTMMHTYASAPPAPQPGYMGVPGAHDYAALGPGGAVPQRKKPPVPEWLRQTLLQRGITPGALPGPPAGQPGPDDEQAAPPAQPRRFTEGSSGSRWAEGEEAGAGRVMGRARADSGSGSDSEGEDEAAKQERRTRMNMELKRHMTSILLEVTDPLFSTLASEALRESLAAARQSAGIAASGKADHAGEADGESDVSSGGPDLLGLGYGSDDNAPVKDTQPATPASKPEAEQKAQTAPVPTVQPDIEAVEARMYSKGDRVWYIARDGARMAATVVSVDISHPPPFFGVCLNGSQGIRETEGHRLAAMTPAEVVEQQEGQPQQLETKQQHSPAETVGAVAASKTKLQDTAAEIAPDIKAEPAAAADQAAVPASKVAQQIKPETNQLTKTEVPPVVKSEPRPAPKIEAQPEQIKEESLPAAMTQSLAEPSVNEELEGHAPLASSAAAEPVLYANGLMTEGRAGEHQQQPVSAAKRKHPEGSSETAREHKRSKGKSKDKSKDKDKDKSKSSGKAGQEQPEKAPASAVVEQPPDPQPAAQDPVQKPDQGKGRHKSKAAHPAQTEASAAAKGKSKEGQPPESRPLEGKPDKASTAQDGSHARDGIAKKGRGSRTEPSSKEQKRSRSPSPHRLHRKRSRSRSRSRQRRSPSVRRRKRSSTPPRRHQHSPSPLRRRRRSPSPPRRRRPISTTPRRRQHSPSPPRRRRLSPSPQRRHRRSLTPRQQRRRSSTPPRQRRSSTPPRHRRSHTTSPRRKRCSPSAAIRHKRSASLETGLSGEQTPKRPQLSERNMKASKQHIKKSKR